MKSLLGLGLIILGIVSFFRYLSIYGFSSIYELIGALIGVSILIVPGILLLKNDNKSEDEK